MKIEDTIKIWTTDWLSLPSSNVCDQHLPSKVESFSNLHSDVTFYWPL